MFEFSMMPVISKPTRVTISITTAINNITINFIFDNDFEGAMIKTDVCSFPSHICH